MIGPVFIDCFTSLDDLPKKLHGDEDSVFQALIYARRVSTFEMTQPLWNTMKRLESKGRIRIEKSGYPWHNVTIVDQQAATKGPGG